VIRKTPDNVEFGPELPGAAEALCKRLRHQRFVVGYCSLRKSKILRRDEAIGESLLLTVSLRACLSHLIVTYVLYSHSTPNRTVTVKTIVM
jgi:hypothetical protein